MPSLGQPPYRRPICRRRPPRSVETFLPAEARASLESSGVAFAVDSESGTLHMARQGFRIGSIGLVDALPARRVDYSLRNHSDIEALR